MCWQLPTDYFEERDGRRWAMATFEKHYTVKELSELWSLSSATIRRMFRSEPGVLKVGAPEERFKRAYFTLLVPETVARRVHERLRNR